MVRVLILEPSAERRALLEKYLDGSQIKLKFFEDINDLQQKVNNHEPHLVLIDIDFWEAEHGPIVDEIQENAFDHRVIGFSQKPQAELLQFSLEHQLLVIPLSNASFFTRPNILTAIQDDRRGQGEASLPEADVSFIGRSPVIQAILQKIDYIARSEVHVLITGETGSGKTVLAKLIHLKSKRRKQPFFHINCAAIPEQLLEAELFGFKKGAFTGAVRDTQGKFKAAGRGTILLDEIGEMPVHLQAKILRVLDEGLYFPVGSVKTESVHARIIAATNKNIEDEIASKKFRKDLYYRLSTIEIHIPPLRERREDIAQLFDFYLDNYVKKYNIKKPAIQPNVYDVLRQYNWPGNIRELQNIVETVMYMKPQQITIEMLPQKLFSNISSTLLRAANEQWTLEEVKREYARYIFNRMNRNKTKSAKILGVDVKTFKKLLNQV